MNHAPLGTSAPQPNEPDVSEYACTVWSPCGKRNTPFHSSRKNNHHDRSALTDKFSRMKLYGSGAEGSKANNWRRNRRPGHDLSAPAEIPSVSVCKCASLVNHERVPSGEPACHLVALTGKPEYQPGSRGRVPVLTGLLSCASQ